MEIQGFFAGNFGFRHKWRPLLRKPPTAILLGAT